MRKTFLAITLFLAFSKAALAQFGNCTASEMRTYVDSATGNTITMLTDTMKNDRFLYQTDPMWTADGKYLLFRSSSRGNDKEVHHTHEGSIGNLCNDEISVLMQKVVDGFNFGTMEQAEKALLSR